MRCSAGANGGPPRRTGTAATTAGRQRLLQALATGLTWAALLALVAPACGRRQLAGVDGDASASAPARGGSANEDGAGFRGWAGDWDCVSQFPSLCKFVEEMPVPEEIDISGGEVLTLGAYNIEQSIHRDLPPTKMYGYGTSQQTASAPGPTLRATRHREAFVQWENHLEDYDYTIPDELKDLVSNGSIPISMHVHGGETEPPSDGHAAGWFTRTGERGPKFVKSLYTYHNGQPPATLWYHDHTQAMTAHNVYFGLAGFYIISDPSGTEKALIDGLPSGEFDVPLLIQNKQLEATGDLHESEHVETGLVETSGVMLVNGKVWPYFNIHKGTYRFRLLNGANLLLLNVSFLLVDAKTKDQYGTGLNFTIPEGQLLPFHQISTDGGYLNTPFLTDKVLLGPAERADVVIDFTSVYQDAVEVYLINTGDIATTESGVPLDSNMGVLAKFIIGPNSKAMDSIPLPATLNNMVRPSTSRAQRTRWLTLTEMQGGTDRIHLLGMHRFTDAPTEILEEGTTEVWALVNLTPQTHTIHIHATKFQLLSRQSFDIDLYVAGNCSFVEPELKSSCTNETLRGAKPGAEMGWKDTILVQAYEITTIVLSITNQDGESYPFDPTLFPGYVWHCHMTEHEDYEMMRPFIIAPPKKEEIVDKILFNNDYPDLSLVSADDDSVA